MCPDKPEKQTTQAALSFDWASELSNLRSDTASENYPRIMDAISLKPEDQWDPAPTSCVG